MNMRYKFNSDSVFSIIIYFLAFSSAAMVLYPLLFVVSASFSDPRLILSGEVILLPKGLNTASFSSIFDNRNILTGYANTIFYAVAGTAYSMFLTICAAYALSKPDLRGCNFLTVMVTLTMFFGGGMIPTFLNLNNLGLLNTRWVMIIPSAMSATNFIIMRNYFIHSVPKELLEAAHIDGASELRTLCQIVLPLSRPILGVITVFYMSGNWNAFFSALIYLTDDSMMPLQVFLRRILIQSTMGGMGTGEGIADVIMFEGLKYALIIASTVPMLILYLFIQKSFKKGFLMGSIKG
jgi:putative aldouronate transport system permease protein